MDLGDIRSLLNRPYSRRVWARVCDWVASQPPDEVARTIAPYIDDHLRHRSDRERPTPRHWRAALMSGAPVAGMQIVRELSLRGFSPPHERRHRDEALMGGLYRLSQRPELRHITTLDVSFNRFSSEALEALAVSEVLTGVRRLVARELSCVEGGHPLTILSRAGWFEQLESLDVRSTSLNEGDFSPALFTRAARLEELDLSKNPIGAHAIEELSESSLGATLRRLGASRVGLGEDFSAAALEFQSLTRLDLSFNALDGAITTLRDAPWRRQLTHLDLTSTSRAGDDGVVALARCGEFAALEHLALASNGLTDAAVRALARAKGFERLRALDLRKNPIGVEAASTLHMSPHLRALKELALDTDRPGKEAS